VAGADTATNAPTAFLRERYRLANKKNLFAENEQAVKAFQPLFYFLSVYFSNVVLTSLLICSQPFYG